MNAGYKYQRSFLCLAKKIWHRSCRKLSQSYVILMAVLEHLCSALPITKAVKAVTNPQSKLCCADVSLSWEESICVCVWGEKKKSIQGGFICSFEVLFHLFEYIFILSQQKIFFFPQNCENYSLMHEKCMYPFSFWMQKIQLSWFYYSVSESEHSRIIWKNGKQAVKCLRLQCFLFPFIHTLRSQAFWRREACTHFICGFYFDMLLLDS